VYDEYGTKRQRNENGWGFVVYLGGILLYAFFASMGACSNSEVRFDSAMRNEGFTQSVQGGYDFWECGVGDVWVNGFVAKRGEQRVSGTVCCGIFKGCTVRWP
jgi:hypothetical protein